MADDFDEEPYFWCDLNGTLVFHEKGTPVFDAEGKFIIGKPVNRMVRRIRRMLSEGTKIKIMSGSVGLGGDRAETAERTIKDWCREHLGRELEVTATITPRCLGIFNDKAIPIVRNTGRVRGERD